MSDKGEKIIKTFAKMVPKLSEIEQEKLLSFSEGMAFFKKKEEEREQAEKEPA